MKGLKKKILFFNFLRPEKPAKAKKNPVPLQKKKASSSSPPVPLKLVPSYPSPPLSYEDKQKLIVEYTPLIRFIAKKISSRLPANIEMDDLISSGVIGLIDAIEKYDPTRNNKFKTYAEFRIRGSILDELRAQDWIPRSVRDKAKVLERASEELESKIGRPPSDPELAEHLGLRVDEFYSLATQARSTKMLSIDEVAIFSNTDRKSLFDILQKKGDPFFDLSVKSIREAIKKCIEELPERQRTVLNLYYYNDMNLKKIGTVLGVTESRVSQLHAQAIEKLKTKMKRRFKKHELKSA